MLGPTGAALKDWEPDSRFFARFPRLREDRRNWKHTSDSTDRYNCFAFVIGDENLNWWPGEGKYPVLWPDGCPKEATLEAFLCALGKFGYSASKSEPPEKYEEGVEKVAVFSKGDEPGHFSRQIAGGSWKSKLGWGVDIEHDFDAVGGGEYGEVVAVVARRKVANGKEAEQAQAAWTEGGSGEGGGR